MKPLTALELIAPCGMNCGICSAFLRDRNTCPGCRAPDAEKPVTRVLCKIKTCATLQKNNFKYCFQCSTFPCASVNHLDKRYRTKYHMSMIENLEHIKTSGIRQFVKDEKARWTCQTCGATINVHKARCSASGRSMTK